MHMLQEEEREGKGVGRGREREVENEERRWVRVRGDVRRKKGRCEENGRRNVSERIIAI